VIYRHCFFAFGAATFGDDFLQAGTDQPNMGEGWLMSGAFYLLPAGIRNFSGKDPFYMLILAYASTVTFSTGPCCRNCIDRDAGC
jgi:hypothetical protein